MLKPCMSRSRINKFSQSELAYISQSLKNGMVNDLALVLREMDESMNRAANSMNRFVIVG